MSAKRDLKRSASSSRTKPSRKGSAHSKSARRTARSKPKDLACPVVGIGGSAGGFEATMELLRHLPARNGMTFVVVQHLDPHHASKLASLLGRATAMPVIEIAKTTKPEPNTVYVQPPNKCVIVQDGALVLVGRTQHVNLTIDQFFESLAEACGSRGIGVLLSGTGSDGTAGLRAIKVAGGLTFAQDEQTAKFAEMPRNAIRSGFVDAVRSPREIAREIRHIVEHPYIRRSAESKSERAAKLDYQKADDLGRIFLSLKKQMGIDFTGYKLETLNRRIQRRMALHRTPKLLKQFFEKRDSTYQISRRVREICTFARQNVITDPPFSRLDLISCRNVLIYLSPELHKRCIPQFHHALNPGGYLILGPAESVGMFDELFELVEKKNKIYAKKMVATPRPSGLADYQGPRFAHPAVKSISAQAVTFGEQLVRAADHIMLNTYAPAAVVIDHELHIHQFR